MYINPRPDAAALIFTGRGQRPPPERHRHRAQPRRRHETRRLLLLPVQVSRRRAAEPAVENPRRLRRPAQKPPHVEVPVIQQHEHDPRHEEGHGEHGHELPVDRPARPDGREPSRHEQAVLQQHDDVENGHGAPVGPVLQVYVRQDVNGGHEGADSEFAVRLSVERALRREQPQEHARPVEQQNEQHPRMVTSSVRRQREDPRGHGPAAPQQLRHDPQPRQDEFIHALHVFAERGEAPADGEQRQGRGHRHQVALRLERAGREQLQLQEQHGGGLQETVHESEHAQIPDFRFDGGEVDGHQEAAVAPEHPQLGDVEQDDRVPGGAGGLPLEVPVQREDLRDEGRRQDDREALREEQPGAGLVQRVDHQDVEDQVAEVGGQGHHVKQEVAERQELRHRFPMRTSHAGGRRAVCIEFE